MKRILIPLVLLAFTLTALAQSGGTVKSVNDTNELVMLNPRSANTNVLVHAMPWLSSSFWTWHEGDATPADTNHLDSVLYPGLGRWVWNNIGTNYFETLVVSNFVGAGDSLWTNLGGILQPQNLTLPVMITNQLQFGPGTTNVLYRSGSDLIYTNGTADVKFIVYNDSGSPTAGASLGATAGNAVLRTAGSATGVILRANTNQVMLSSDGFGPLTSLAELSGNLIRPWHTVTTSNLWIESYAEIPGPTSWDRLSIYKAGTNSPAIFDIQTWGTGTNGANAGFSFRTNGVEVFNVTGTGGPSSGANWVASGTTNSTLAGTATMLKSIDAHNAKYWGATGNGTANDTVALQTGLNYVGTNGGGWFYIPSGTYAITNSLVVTNSGVHVIGDGIGRTVLKEVDGTRLGVTVNGASIIATMAMVAVSNCSISHLSVDHTATTNDMNGLVIIPDGATYTGTAPDQCAIHHCAVAGKDAHQYLVWCRGAKNSRVEDNEIDGMGAMNDSQEGIEIFGGTNIWVSKNTVTRIGSAAVVLGVGLDGIIVRENQIDTATNGVFINTTFLTTPQNAHNVQIVDNIVRNCRFAGIYGINASNCAISSLNIDRNIITNCVDAVYLYGVGTFEGGTNGFEDISVSANQINYTTNAVQGGITLKYWKDTIISRNNLVRPSFYGIMATLNCGNLTIDGNIIRNPWGNGISVDLGCTNVTIVNNQISGFGRSAAGVPAITMDGSTNLYCYGNTFIDGGTSPFYILATATCDGVFANGNPAMSLGNGWGDVDLTPGVRILSLNSSYGSLASSAGITTLTITNRLIGYFRSIRIREVAGTTIPAFRIQRNVPPLRTKDSSRGQSDRSRGSALRCRSTPHQRPRWSAIGSETGRRTSLSSSGA